MADVGETRSPLKTLTAFTELDGIGTDFVVSNFEDRLFIVVTQYGKFGTMIQVNKDRAIDGTDETTTYNTKVLFGQDDQTLQVIGRSLAEKLNVPKPVLFSLALKDPTPKTMRSIADELQKLMR